MNKRHRRPEDTKRFAERNGVPTKVGHLADLIMYRLGKRLPK